MSAHLNTHLDLFARQMAAAFPDRTMMVFAILPQGAVIANQPVPPMIAPASVSASSATAQWSTSIDDTTKGDSTAGSGPGASERPKAPRGKKCPRSEKVRQVQQADGDIELSREEWAERLGTGTRRLLDRMVKHAAVPTTRKKGTKAHRAQLVRASDLVNAFAVIEAVEAEKMDPPAWYGEVVRAA